VGEDINSTRCYSFFVIILVLTIVFSLISVSILKANTTIGMAAYAKKSKKPSEENSNDGGGSSGKSGDSGGGGGGGSDSKDKKNNDQRTNDNEQQQQVKPPKIGEGEEQETKYHYS